MGGTESQKLAKETGRDREVLENPGRTAVLGRPGAGEWSRARSEGLSHLGDISELGRGYAAGGQKPGRAGRVGGREKMEAQSARFSLVAFS